MYFVFRKFIMSHHIVTVCVVCVLCAAHVPCSAHTNLSATMHNSTNTRDPSSPNVQPSSTLISSKNTHPYAKSQSSYPNNVVSNKRDTVRFQNTRYVNRNNNNNNIPVVVNAVPTASHDAYLIKKEIMENFKGGGNVRSTQPSIESVDDTSVNSRNVELSKRLVQPELLSNVKDKSADLHTSYRSRLKRDVDETYLTKKIFEAYGDGTSMTMEGFEKLVRKLGLHKLIDASKLENGGTETSMHKN